MLFTVGFTLITRSKTSAVSKYCSNLSYKKYGGIGTICMIYDVVFTSFRARSGYEYPATLKVLLVDN